MLVSFGFCCELVLSERRILLLARWDRLFYAHGSDSWTVVIEGMVGDYSGSMPLYNCDRLLFSSAGRRSCRLDCREAVTAMEWLFASGVAVDLCGR